VKDNVGQTQLVYYVGVNETTCFGLLGGHHQVYNVGSKRLMPTHVCRTHLRITIWTPFPKTNSGRPTEPKDDDPRL